MWVLLLIPLAILIAVAIYFERKGKKSVEDSNLSVKDKETLEQDFMEHGAGNESRKPENL